LRAALLRFTGGDMSFVAPLNVVTGANVRRLSIPLSQLGGDHGRLRFKLACYQVTASSSSSAGATQTITQDLDTMPNVGLPAGVVR
jgi:hypothetical protein